MKYNQDRIKKFKSWDEIHTKWMKDPEYKAAYDTLEDEFRLVELMISLRVDKKLTQAELAERVGMKQSAIARLESGKASPSFKTLNRIAKALDQKITFVKG